MLNKTVLVAGVAATTILVAGFALAESGAAPTNAQTSGNQSSLDKDFGKLSADGARAYQDVTLTRLAIFDGRTDDAKKFIQEADQDFAKAKTADTVFMKAEGDLKTAAEVKEGAGKTDAGTTDVPQAKAAKGETAKTQIAWLPVDGVIGLNEDYTMKPEKAKAVADANKSLAAGDRKGAMDTLKLADVDMNVVLAVVPLNQTISDVHQAAQLIDSGKYYEGSQTLRKINLATRYDVAIYGAGPKAATAATPAEPPKTH